MLKNKVLSLLETPPKLNLLVTHFFFIAENTYHWIHSVLMTYTLQRGCCSKNNGTDSSSNICSLASHSLSLNSGAVKMCSSCTLPQSSLYWPLLEASWAAGGQIRPTRARLVSIPLSLHPSLPMLQPWRNAFYSFFFSFSSSKEEKLPSLRCFHLLWKRARNTHIWKTKAGNLFKFIVPSDEWGQWLQTAWSLKASSVQKGRGSSCMRSITAWHIAGLLDKGMYFLCEIVP